MGNGHRVTYETTVSEPDEDRPARLFVWVRHFEGDEELTGRYEVFEDLPRLDEFIARTAEAGEDTAALKAARETFATTLGQAT
jgi:hypothetical protein